MTSLARVGSSPDVGGGSAGRNVLRARTPGVEPLLARERPRYQRGRFVAEQGGDREVGLDGTDVSTIRSSLMVRPQASDTGFDDRQRFDQAQRSAVSRRPPVTDRP